MKKYILRLINKLGYHIDKIDRNSLTMAGGLARAAVHVNISTIIDIGASDGRWSALAMTHFPTANYLLVEAQEGHRKDLEYFKSKHSNVSLCMAAAGDTEGEIYFDASDLHAGLASKEKLDTNCIVVPVTTIDKQVKERQLKPPYCVKLDTHGFEVPILEGAKETLAQAELVIIEVYNFQLVRTESTQSLRFFEMCAYLEQQGFLCTDIVDMMRRPKDNVLWQMDMFFYRASNPVFQSNQYN